MPKLLNTTVPAYRRHKSSGQAVVTLNGQDIYLGLHNTTDSREKYSRIIAEWLAAGRNLPADPLAVTVAEIVLAYLKHADAYYPASDEPNSIKQAMRPLLKLYARTPAVELGPLALQAVQREMVAMGWSRNFCNQQLGRIKRMVKWAARQELVPAELFHRLQIVGGLPKGRCEAHESEPVRPVPEHIFHATLPHLGRHVKAMVEIQLLTGARPAEICNLRGSDLDTTGKVWIAKLDKHKNAHHGHSRELYLGPRAQEIIKPFLKTDLAAYIFDPRQAEQERRQHLHSIRKTPFSCGNRPGTNRVRKPRRQAGDHYDENSYRRAIHRACDRADVLAKAGVLIGDDERIIERWGPHRLRHSRATTLRKLYGVEAARVILQHKNLNVTELYAERDTEQAIQIMSKIG